MDWFIIGTAGHVDHGKTQLVKALTGQDTDRLKEEKKRGISIELGFASLKLPNGDNAAIIDVPGHERFIKQMLAGVAGIDMVMLIIAADEGIMPQTREHMEIIKLLRIKKGLTVITKIDLVDEEWLELIEEDIREFIKGTVLAHGPILKVSALKNQGIDNLINEIQKLAEADTDHHREGQLRLPVDRSFVLSGFGTVVTGTLWSGEVKTGDIVEIQPIGKKSRVRGIQVHGHPQQSAKPGQRVALNLSDVEVDEVPRGSSVVSAGAYAPSYILDAKLQLIESAAKPLKQRQRVRVHLGTSEKLARINLLSCDELAPGEETYVQLQMEEPLIAQRGDRFVIRSYSPMFTIGGGTILEPYGEKLKRFQDEVIETLQIKEESNPEDLIIYTLDKIKDKLLTIDDLAGQLNLGTNMVRDYVNKMEGILTIEGEGNRYIIGQKTYEKWLAALCKELEAFHGKYPLRPGLDKEEARSKLFPRFSIKEFNLLLGTWQKESRIKTAGAHIYLPDFTPALDEKTKQLIGLIEDVFLKSGFQPPAFEETFQKVKAPAAQREEILKYMVGQGILVKVAENMYFHIKTIEKAKALLKEGFNQKEAMALSDIRDLFDSSRKFVLPLLEYFDAQKFTKRVEDKRVLFKKD
ncbi:selenocysteine-specific translation elongation factor [Desulfitibacter alkalitolerans]|uniref:selenocysteine-specific translation elongation factor n=1 Tax=Desulfitibacter alkalitolerans TaxID=264641 RepID=UPI000487A907|nr:selenocysteine-specific translation elongation factor [Desulfitibacter alkalitolerans]